MGIIDEKGRIFNKINVIDFLVVLFLFSLVPIFYFGYKILTNRSGVIMPEKEFVEMEIDYRFIKVKPELAEVISVGDKELNESGRVIGEIVSLGQSEPYRYEFDIGERQKIIKEDPNLRQIDARLKLKAEVKRGKPYYKDMEIRIDKSLEFKTDRYILTAIPFEEEEERTIDLNVILKDLDEDLVKEISVGGKELDGRGNTIAEILSLGKVESSSTEYDLGEGSLVMGDDGTKKQLSVKMRLKCQVKDDNKLYFKGKKVEYNTPLEFEIYNYKVIGLVALKERCVSIRVKFSEVVPEIAKIIQKGDTEKDTFEKTIASIGSIISNEPAQVTTIFEGKFITVSHPFLRDIVVSLDVLCVEKEGAYYYKDYLVKIGNDIVFYTDSYSISGMIIGIEGK